MTIAPNGFAAVITDVAAVHATTTRSEAECHADSSAAIWHGRAERFNRALGRMGGTGHDSAEPFRGIYLEDPVEAAPSETAAKLPVPMVSTGERISLHLIETLTGGAPSAPRSMHVVTADPQEDVAKQTFLMAAGATIPPEQIASFFDPLGLYCSIPGLGRPSVSRVVEASASGVVALVDAAERVSAGNGGALVTATSGKSIAIPFETAPVGFGESRQSLPFTDGACGHYNAEGGVGLRLMDADSYDGPVLARVIGAAHGTFGSRVVNRQVVTAVVLRALRSAGVDTATRLFVDLYGRGNPIDDGAELAAMEWVQKTYPLLETGYLKGQTHYVIGAHGLQGLVRLLQRRAAGAPVDDLAIHPGGNVVGRRPVPHLRANPEDFDVFVFVAYSLHGSCVAVVVDLAGCDRAIRASRTGEVAA